MSPARFQGGAHQPTVMNRIKELVMSSMQEVMPSMVIGGGGGKERSRLIKIKR